MTPKIDAMIIGAQKAGTTSLNQYLAQHPNIYTHEPQEFGMFADVESFEKGFNYHYRHTVITPTDPAKNIFVAKHARAMYEKELLIKLKKHNPGVKIIAVLRNPIDRAYSAFTYFRKNGMEPYENFDDCIYKNDASRFKGNAKIQKNCDYLELSSYSNYLRDIYEIFPKENVRVYIFEQIISNLDFYLNDMCRLIGVNSDIQFDTQKKYNEKGKARSQLVSQLTAPGKNKIIKNILPYKLRTKLRKLIKKANLKKDDGFENMSPQTRQFLKDFFRTEVENVASVLHLPVQEFWKDFSFTKIIE
jgi:sulfotransferase family protein